jgi:hypothetical protein
VKKAPLAANMRKGEKSKPCISFENTYFALRCNKTGFYLNELAELKNGAVIFFSFKGTVPYNPATIHPQLNYL